MAVISIPASSAAPRSCPTCGLEWLLCGVGSDEDGAPEIRLLCMNWHELPRSVSLQEAALFLVTNHPDELLGNPMWLVGEHTRLADGGQSRVWVEPGRRFTLRGELYEVVAIETERIWVGRVGRPVPAPTTEAGGSPPEPASRP